MGTGRDHREGPGKSALTSFLERAAFEPDRSVAINKRGVPATAAEGLRIVGPFDQVDGLAIFNH